jgi:NADH:ubiquinone reductase (non-electrogenic)
MKQSGVSIVKGMVQEVQEEKIVLKDGTEIPYGLLVWSTGVGPSEFVSKLVLPKSHARFVK